MKDFLEAIIKNLVQNPDQVVVAEQEAADRTVLTITVADDDMGRIIGKEGKVINAIRMIMRVMAIRHDKRVRIDIEDKNRPAEMATNQPVVATAPTAQPDMPSASVTPADIVGQPVAPTTTS